MTSTIDRISRSAATVLATVAVASLFNISTAFAQLQEPPIIPGSLKNIAVPEPPDLGSYVRNKAAAIQLGKALFWDEQLGSDNQACASCHFHAGADDRTKNQLDPGLRANPPDHTFQLGGPNYQLKPSDYPFHKLVDPSTRLAGVLSDINDVTSSQGVFYKQLKTNNGQSPNPTDGGKTLDDPDFTTASGMQVRRVPPRNTPSNINAVFNVENFWDGRANYYFNGNNPFGPLDMSSGILVAAANGALQKQIVRIAKSSLASQAVGPALSDMEMSFVGRSWPDVGKKMMMVRPLALQLVHPNDSVLGPLSNQRQLAGANGINTDYASMVKAAFWDQYWNSPMFVTFDANGNQVFNAPVKRPLKSDEYAQIEANFAFFFGLAIQTYEATLVSNDSRFDQFKDGGNYFALTLVEQLGMQVYQGKGKCANCHTGAEFTNASMSFRAVETRNRIELMPMGPNIGPIGPDFDTINPFSAFYDGGWYNIGVRPINDDVGRVGDSPFINPMTGAPFPLSETKLSILKKARMLPPEVARYVETLPVGNPFGPVDKTAVAGCFKVPSLRNTELTGPYYHNGGQATLRQVVDFYDRGGDFHDENIADLHPDIGELFLTPDEKTQLIYFILALTDERVRWEKAPFDHPQLYIPNGATDKGNGKNNEKDINGWHLSDDLRVLPAVGADGLKAEGLPPLGSFMGLDPFQPVTQ